MQLATVIFTTLLLSQNIIWWEAERPRSTSFPRQSWLSPGDDERGLLSSGDWLTNTGKRGAAVAYASYGVRVEDAGTYDLWCRKFWKHGPFRWRFDDRDWTICGRRVGLIDRTHLRALVTANWVHLGQLELDPGRHEFRIELLAEAGDDLVAAFDCFVLSSGAFLPCGRIKPGAALESPDDEWFVVPPLPDEFDDAALLDLGGLNEDTAGADGFVTVEDGGFRLGGGAPVRFWSVNVGPGNIAQSHRSMDYLARRLAKLGVNMVRYHGEIFDKSRYDESVDQRALDDLFYLVAALKREGIYTTISTYFPAWYRPVPTSGIEGYDPEHGRPWAIMFIDERLQSHYRGWLNELLTKKNPYTGVALAEEAAVAMVELVNEDSLLFWTFTSRDVPPVHWRAFEDLFTAWAAARHGTIEAAFKHWGRAKAPRDDLDAGHAGLMDIWHLTTDGAKGRAKRRRAADQTRFLVELQRGFYKSMRDYVKEDLGYRGLIVAGNWTVADPRLHDALERSTYTVGDVIDRHGYFSSPHAGEGAGYRMAAGQRYENRTALRAPEDMPVQANQVRGYPQIISELGWPNPNRFRAEGTFLASAYGALQGIDGLFFFAVGSNFLADGGLRKFPVSAPVVAGTFPATALMYRRGDVREPDPVVVQPLDMEALFALKGSDGAAAANLDAFRAGDVPDGSHAIDTGGLPRHLFFVGPVMRTFDGAAGAGGWVPGRFEECLDDGAGVVRAVTGELEWDTRRGVVTVNTPRSQGALGFLAPEPPIELDDVTIRCGNEFAAILIVSLDDRPLRESRRVLVQVVTEEKPDGFETVTDGEIIRITDLGGAPFLMRRIDVTVTLPPLPDTTSVRVVPLDVNGYATDKTAAVEGDGIDTPLRVRLADDAMYHVIIRDEATHARPE